MFKTYTIYTQATSQGRGKQCLILKLTTISARAAICYSQPSPQTPAKKDWLVSSLKSLTQKSTGKKARESSMGCGIRKFFLPYLPVPSLVVVVKYVLRREKQKNKIHKKKVHRIVNGVV